jgi:hypothetical protein
MRSNQKTTKIKKRLYKDLTKSKKLMKTKRKRNQIRLKTVLSSNQTDSITLLTFLTNQIRFQRKKMLTFKIKTVLLTKITTLLLKK